MATSNRPKTFGPTPVPEPETIFIFETGLVLSPILDLERRKSKIFLIKTLRQGQKWLSLFYPGYDASCEFWDLRKPKYKSHFNLMPINNVSRVYATKTNLSYV